MSPAPARSLSMTQVLLCGAAIVTLSMGIRHGKRRRLVTVIAWAAAALALALGFVAYRRPDVAVDLANQLWNCF